MNAATDDGYASTMSVRSLVSSATRIGAEITGPNDRSFTVVTEANYTLNSSPTPWLSATLPAAMKANMSLTLAGDVDEAALDNSNRAQDVLSMWYPRHYPRVVVEAQTTPASADRASGVGCFFSGGVDSFYSAFTRSEQITHLIFVHGFDIAIDDAELAAEALQAARAAAAEIGKPLIEVRTTLRSAFGDPLELTWGHIYHGAALAHVANALSPHLGTVIVPSSFRTDQLHPWGSHPDLDSAWSSSTMTIEHDNVDVGRFQKIRAISDSSIAMKHLRVCWQNRDGRFNCGRCSKCLRTKLGIEIAGAQCMTLPGSLDPKAIRRMYVDQTERMFLREALTELREGDLNAPELERAVRSAIRRSYVLQYFARG
ncbi:hypothetical protein G8C36_06745 [Gordonia terrae]|nr:hypothetical protein G8C36_06745 [Gordonia terrae]